MVSKRRGRSEGAVYRRKSDGRWLGVVDLGWQDGKRVRKYVSARTRAEVVDKLRALQAGLNAGLPPPDNRITVGEFLEHWLTNVLPGSVGSLNTIDNYAWAARGHIIPALGRKRLVKLTPADVAELLRTKTEAGMAKSSVGRLRSVLVAALAHAVLEGLVGRNVAALVRGPRGEVPDGRSLTVEQARAFLTAAKGERLEAAYATMLMLGLRPGEVLGLTWADVDLKGRRLQVNRSLKLERGELRLGAPKTRRSRRALVLPKPVISALRAHRRRQVQERIGAGPGWEDLDLVFPTSVGTLIDPSNFRRHLSAVTQRAGLGHWHPHELRHSAASLLSAAGLRLEEIADVLGHSSTRMTGDVYRHAVLPAVSAGVRSMEQLFDAE